MPFFENARKPMGLGGKLMVAMMNLGHSTEAGGEWTREQLLLQLRRGAVRCRPSGRRRRT